MEVRTPTHSKHWADAPWRFLRDVCLAGWLPLITGALWVGPAGLGGRPSGSRITIPENFLCAINGKGLRGARIVFDSLDDATSGTSTI